MSFSSNGVTFNRTKWIRNRIFKFLFRGAEGILSVLFVISLAAPMIFPKDVNAALGVSSKLSYQGRLTDTSGNPYTGTYYVCFSIWDVATGGTANPNQLWPASFAVPASNTVTVTNGVFNAGVGVADALNFDFSSSDTVYLNVGVSASNVTCDNGAMENLTPRQRLDATPYARVAENLYGGNARIGTGAGVTSNNQKYIHLDKVTGGNAENTGDACPTGSVNGSVWYNSSRTRALMCETNIIKTISLVEGIKEQSVASGSEIKYGVVNLSGSNNITISQTGSTLQFSVPTPVQGFGMSNIGNTLGTSGSGTGTIVLAGGNNITLSQATGAGARTITIIGPAGGGAGIQGSGTYSQNTGTVQFGNSNGITFGLSNNGTMTASHNGLTSQSNQALSAANGSFAFQTASFANSNGISFSTGTQGIYASHNGLTVQSAQPVAISGSNGSFAFSTVSFGNLNGLSFYTSNGSIVGSYTAGGGGGVAVAGGTSTATNGTVIFSNSPTVSFGLNNGTMTASAAGGGGAAPNIAYWDNMPGGATALGAAGGLNFGASYRSLFVVPLNGFYKPFDGNITAQTAHINLLLSGSTATMSAAFTSNFYLGIYTMNTGVSSLSLLNSVNASFAMNPAATNNSTAFVGQRFLSIHSSQWSAQPVFNDGSQYWLGYFWSSAGILNNVSNSMLGFYRYSTAQRSGTIKPAASNTATSMGWGPFYGIYTATTGAMPTAINNTQLNKVNANAGFSPHVIFNNSAPGAF